MTHVDLVTLCSTPLYAWYSVRVGAPAPAPGSTAVLRSRCLVSNHCLPIVQLKRGEVLDLLLSMGEYECN